MIKTRETPKIMSLEIEPIENIEVEEKPNPNNIVEQSKIIEEELPIEEVNPDDAMFKRVEQKPKKKKMLSDKQKAHMQKMRKARELKRAEKKALQNQKKEADKQRRMEELKNKVESQKPVKMQIPKEIKKELPKEVIKQVEQTMPPKPRGMTNQEYMKEFFNNLNLFMDSYNKLSSKKNNFQTQTATQNQKMHSNKPQKKEEPKIEKFSFRDSMVSYRNVRNPFNF